MAKLSLNIDHVATLRQARDTSYPDPVEIAVLAQLGGVDGITVHPREDRRHIQDRDVHILKEILKVPLTLEMALTDEMVDFALEINPFCCTLVPEARRERTTENGLRIIGNESELHPRIERLLDGDIQISLFLDAEIDQIIAAQSLGVQFIEIHTGPFVLAKNSAEEEEEFQKVANAAERATELGLKVNAGHGLHYHNTERIAALPMIEWIHTGHSIISHALYVGMEQAVRDMKEILYRAEFDSPS